ncbi:LysR substrate-binding domain-containing protein [Celerinatantimonas sp. YJH-8]|uniref:LysR substrate-binding domain-containing protein n=1 Tax=Celerinatantimonas sp. YJH-8 TaxID=3228714 RepID=UPI0038C7F32F
MREHQHLDLDALRCFVLGIELGSFALAAQRLHRSTSAASAQLKKLEQMSSEPLVQKQGRNLQPTAAGEKLLSYARRLLALNDEAVSALSTPQQGEEILRFGMQEDFSEMLLPSILAQFARAHPNVQLSVHVARNRELFQAIEQAKLDFSLSWVSAQTPAYSDMLAQLPLCWITPADLALQAVLLRCQPLPLVMFEAPCLMRQIATQALDQAGIKWRIVFESSNLSSIWKAVSEGLGITLRSSFALPASVTSCQSPLPELPHIGIRLDRAHESASILQQQFREFLLQQLSPYLHMVEQ